MLAAQINTIQLLRDIGWASSNNEARRMIQSGGLYIDDERHEEEEFYFAGSSFIMRYGRRKFVRVHIPVLKEHYEE